MDHTPDAVWGLTFVDLDQDANEDVAAISGLILTVEQESKPYEKYEDFILMANADGTFEDRSSDWEFADQSQGRAVVVGDLNDDGYPDLVTAGMAYVTVWSNRGADCRRGINLRLQGPPGNVHGIGAEIALTVDDRVLRRWMWPGTTYSSSVPELYLGLGDVPSAAKLEVFWPHGATSVLKNVKPGTLTVTAD